MNPFIHFTFFSFSEPFFSVSPPQFDIDIVGRLHVSPATTVTGQSTALYLEFLLISNVLPTGRRPASRNTQRPSAQTRQREPGPTK